MRYWLGMLLWGLMALPSVVAQSLPSQVYLEGVAMVYQDVNRCSAAALTIQLSYWETERVDYRQVIERLNPHAEDVSVRIEEMAAHAVERGWGAIVRRNGSLLLLKQLVASGFPVLVENTYYESADQDRGWLSHNRVLVGYDDAKQELYFYDSLLGNGADGRGRAFSYQDFDSRWLAFNRDYLVVYSPEQEPRLQTILGDDWDSETNAFNTLEQAELDITAFSKNSDKAFAYMNKGWAFTQLGDYEQAVEAFEAGMALGLPWRYFWYEFSVFEAYYHTERYDDLIALAEKTLLSSKGIEELYYYIGLAREAQGDIPRAKGNLEMAIFRNANFAEAQAKLALLMETEN